MAKASGGNGWRDQDKDGKARKTEACESKAVSEGRGNVIRTMQDEEEEGAGRVKGRQEKGKGGGRWQKQQPKEAEA